jgi:hypothetical protein
VTWATVSCHTVAQWPGAHTRCPRCAKTFLHNQFIVPRAKFDPAAVSGLFGSDTALKAEAAAMLAGMLDDIDEVYVRLDLRVVEGLPEAVPLDDLAQRDRTVVELASTMTPHEAAWFALRPDACPSPQHPLAGFERAMTQLPLPLGTGSTDDGSLANMTAMEMVGVVPRAARSQRRSAGRKAVPMPLRLVQTAATKVSCTVGYDDFMGSGNVAPGERHGATVRREVAPLQRQ